MQATSVKQAASYLTDPSVFFSEASLFLTDPSVFFSEAARFHFFSCS
jgi:hypothetical protein